MAAVADANGTSPVAPAATPAHRCLILANMAAGKLRSHERGARFLKRIRAMFSEDEPVIPDAPVTLTEIAELAAAAGIEANVEPMPGPDALPRLLRAAEMEGFHTVVAAGGDRSVHTVAQNLIGSRLNLGILPVGTANNIARTLGIPFGLQSAIQVLSTGVVCKVDVGRINGEYFLEAAGVGLFAEVMQAVGANELRKHQIARLIKIMAPIFLKPPSRTLHLVLDGEPYHREAVMVTVANTAYLGEGMHISPMARLDDGMFDVVIASAPTPRELAHFGMSLMRGRHLDLPGVTRIAASQVEISRVRGVSKAIPVHADDRIVAHTPVTISICPGALRVIAPATDEGLGTPNA